MITPNDFRFFLDSGAYSAWSKGTVIDIDEYCQFIRANIDQLEVYASLDVIPGVPGRVATPDERDAAAEQSWRNYLYMVADGLNPLPVYHYGEDARFLDRMLEHGCEYIGVGGLVGIPGPSRQRWLDRLFDVLVDDAGQPRVKTHGFGMTSIPLIFRYPWYSVDSTTWIKITAMGGVYLPAMRDGKFVFDEVPTVITTSISNPKAIGGDLTHYRNLPDSVKLLFRRWVDLCGKTIAEVTDSYRHRATCNVMFFKLVSEQKANKPWVKSNAPRSNGFFL